MRRAFFLLAGLALACYDGAREMFRAPDDTFGRRSYGGGGKPSKRGKTWQQVRRTRKRNRIAKQSRKQNRH